MVRGDAPSHGPHKSKQAAAFEGLDGLGGIFAAISMGIYLPWRTVINSTGNSQEMPENRLGYFPDF